MKVDPAVTLYAIGIDRKWPVFLPEWRFHEKRKWRIDLAIPSRKIGIEIEGLVYQGKGGRHQRAAGYIGDLEKYAEAAALGWIILRFAPQQINQNLTWVITIIEKVLALRSQPPDGRDGPEECLIEKRVPNLSRSVNTGRT